MGRNSYLLVLLFVLVILVAGMVSCGPEPAVTTQVTKTPSTEIAEKTYTFKFTTASPKDVYEQGWVPYLAVIEAESRGKIKFEKYPNGSLLPDPSAVDGIALGIADCGQTAELSFQSRRFPMSELAFLPFTWSTGVEGSRVRRQFARYPAVAEEYEKTGLKCIMPEASPAYALVTTKKVQSFEDMSGLKLASWGSIMPKLLTLYNAEPVLLPMQERYSGLQMGLLDGSPSSFDLIYNFNLYEVAKYISIFPDETSIAEGCVSLVWNLEAWNKLPTDIQNIILRVTDSKYWIGEAWDDVNVKNKAKLQEAGVTFFYLPIAEKTKFMEQVDTLAEWWIDQRKHEGPSQEVYNYYLSLLKAAGLR